jgi:hypothetical protein
VLGLSELKFIENCKVNYIFGANLHNQVRQSLRASSNQDPAISKRVEAANLITNINVSDAGANGLQTPTADNTSAHPKRPLMIQPPP